MIKNKNQNKMESNKRKIIIGKKLDIRRKNRVKILLLKKLICN